MSKMSYDGLLTVRNSLIGILKKIDKEVQIDENDTALEILDLIKENFEPGAGSTSMLKVTIGFDEESEGYIADYTFEQIQTALDDNILVYVTFGDTIKYYYIDSYEKDALISFVNSGEGRTFEVNNTNKWLSGFTQM